MLLMMKGSKEALTVLIVTHVTHVERVKRLHYVHNIDTFNAMLKHIEGVESQNNFRPLQHTWHWMVWLERSKSQLSKTFFRLKIH